jgi:hypothetical protein
VALTRSQIGAALPEPVARVARASIGAGRRLGLRAHGLLRFGGRPRFQLAICATFRDEARYLAEWVTFHRLQGVEQFWLYDNLSADDWQSELAPEMQSGFVTVTPWPEEPAQLAAYADCLRRHRGDARWIAFIDIDEFLFSPLGRSLPEVLHGFESYAGVAVNWRIYGTNGHREPPEGLVIENYVMRGRDRHPDNRFVKLIVQPRRTLRPYGGPHTFEHLGFAVGEDRCPVRSHLRAPASVEVLRINHYYSRSMVELARKRARPNATDGEVRETAQVPADDVCDDAILRFLPALREALASRAEPG